jgi:hypothetical protein
VGKRDNGGMEREGEREMEGEGAKGGWVGRCVLPAFAYNEMALPHAMCTVMNVYPDKVEKHGNMFRMSVSCMLRIGSYVDDAQRSEANLSVAGRAPWFICCNRSSIEDSMPC